MEIVSSMHVWKLDQIYFLVCARNAACIEIPGEIHQENNLIVREEAQFRKNGVTVFQSQLMLAIQNNDIWNSYSAKKLESLKKKKIESQVYYQIFHKKLRIIFVAHVILILK